MRNNVRYFLRGEDLDELLAAIHREEVRQQAETNVFRAVCTRARLSLLKEAVKADYVNEKAKKLYKRTRTELREQKRRERENWAEIANEQARLNQAVSETSEVLENQWKQEE